MFPTEMALMVLYAKEFLCSPILFGFYRIPYCDGLLESAFRAVVNRSRVYPPLAGLPTVILEGWSAGHLLTAPFTGGKTEGLRMIPIHELFSESTSRSTNPLPQFTMTTTKQRL